MLRVALVGIGDAGRHHARALATLEREGVLAWSAFVARDAARIEPFRKETGATAPSFASLDALLDARACDAVVLATPDGLHGEQVVRAADAGVHVLVEKPLALSREDGARAVDAARARGVALQVGYQLRHHAGHRVMKEKLAEIGALREIDVRWAWPDPATTGWRARGQDARFWALAALGTHAIDLALFFADATPIRTTMLRAPASGVDRASHVVMELGTGVLAHVSCSVTHRALSRVLLVGDRGELEALGTLGARGTGAIALRPLRDEPRPIAFEAVDPYLAQLRAFVARRGFVPDDALLANLDVLDAQP